MKQRARRPYQAPVIVKRDLLTVIAAALPTGKTPD
jgi:hypothetical protein